jgi:hypothetical protein
MFSLTPDAKPGRPKQTSRLGPTRRPARPSPPPAHLRPMLSPAEAADHRAAWDSRSSAWSATGSTPAVTIRGQAQMPGVKPAALRLSHAHWRRPGIVDSDESLVDEEARARA